MKTEHKKNSTYTKWVKTVINTFDHGKLWSTTDAENTPQRFLVHVIKIVVMMQVISVAFVLYLFITVFSANQEEYIQRLSDQMRTRLTGVFSGAIEDVYVMNTTALDVRLQTMAQRHWQQTNKIPLCLTLMAIANPYNEPYRTKHCVPDQNLPQQHAAFEPVTESMEITAGEITMLSITWTLYMPQRTWYGLPKPFWPAMVAGVVGITLISVWMTLALYRRVLIPLFNRLQCNNEELLAKNTLIQNNLLTEQRNLKIVQSLQRIAEAVATTSPTQLEQIYSQELRSNPVFTGMLLHSKSCPVDTTSTMGQFLHQHYGALSDYTQAKNSTVVVLDLDKESVLPQSTTNDSINGYLIALHLTPNNSPLLIWVDRQANTIDEFVYNYFDHLAQQYHRYETVNASITHNAIDTVNRIASKSGQLPINHDTVYVLYEHPYALIYDNQRQEIKKRVSLSRLLALFSEHLLQINKSCLINPVYLMKEPVHGNEDAIRILVGSAITRLKVGKRFLPQLQPFLKDNHHA